MPRLLLLTAPLALVACVVVEKTPPAAVRCAIPTWSPPDGDVPLAQVQANAATALPGGELGYLVTASGQGSYRVTWTDTLNTAACFGGIITSSGRIAATTPLTGTEAVEASSPNQVRFASVPGRQVHGVDVEVTTNPLYLDLFIDGSPAGVKVFYTSGPGGIVAQAAPPLAVTSP